MNGYTLRELLIIAALSAAGIGIVTPHHLRADAERRRVECIERLLAIDGAKEQFYIESGPEIGQSVTMADLIAPGKPGFLTVAPVEPCGGNYAVGTIGGDPRCTAGIPGHAIPPIAVCLSG